MIELTLDQALKKGIEAHKAGQFTEADRYYTAILKAQPKHPDANHNMGALAVGIGKVQEALPLFKLALETNPKHVQFWVSYIGALIKLGQLDNARQILEQGKASGLKGEKVNQLETQLCDTGNFIPSSIGNSTSPSQQQIQGLIVLYTQGET